jgi:hypothetical protein
MVACGSPGIILGPTGNEQGTYKVTNLATGKKIKRRSFTKMPMPNSAIRQVETLGKPAGKVTLDFANRNGILFEWDDEDDCHEQLVEEEAVCYPSLTRKFPGIALNCDLPVPSIEDKYEPQGCAKDTAALNANIVPCAIAGGDGPIIINADDDKIEVYNNDGDGIIAVADIPHNNNAGAHATINNSDDNIDAENDGNDASNDNDCDDKEASIEHESDDEVSVPGVRHSKQKTKGKTTRFAKYGLMMAAQCNARKSKKVQGNYPRWNDVLLGRFPKRRKANPRGGS